MMVNAAGIKPIRVLVVDDSSLVRDILTKGLAQDPGLEVVGQAADPYEARDKILNLKPDVVTLDVEMPRMNGVEFLKYLMPQHPIPVVMVSAHTEKGKKITLEALDAGAVDFVTKPSADMARGLAEMLGELRTKVKIASVANVGHWKFKRPPLEADLAQKALEKKMSATAGALAQPRRYKDVVLVVGASTGGTEALREMLEAMPADIPAMVVVQHMPVGFTEIFARRLNESCAMQVKEAVNGDLVVPGRVLIAPGGFHMRLAQHKEQLAVELTTGSKINGHMPSVDPLMLSAAKVLKDKAVGIMLTGMGGDGADGLLAMRQAGAKTLAQDEATCVVFGMPKVAWDKGAVEKLIPLDRMAQVILDLSI